MTGWQLLTSGWDWEPSVIIGCAALLVGYLALLRFRFARRGWFFVAGVFTLFIALTSPIDTLGDTYLFSAHMLQHILLILAIPPLLLLGIPDEIAEKWLHQPFISRAERALNRPLLAWSLGIGTMWIWHWPPLYNAALAHEPLHILQHLTFLVSATIFWWPILAPLERLRLPPLAAAVYVFAACTAHTALAILLTFAPAGLYPAYLHPADPLHILPLIRDQWGISAQNDQQWGGLLMWVPTCFVFLGFIIICLARWYGAPEPDVIDGVVGSVPAVASSGTAESYQAN